MLLFGILLNSQSVAAQEIAEKDVVNEYLEKKENGVIMDEIYDEDGRLVAYYEPFSESNPMPVMPRWSINWTVSPGYYMYSDEIKSMKTGTKVYVSITQNRTGSSYLTFCNRDTGNSLRFTNTLTTNGWNGTVTFVNVSESRFSFGIENASSATITYSGTYTIS